MSEISATVVKELRLKTGAGMMDCKKALAETAGDLEAAVDWLRKKGLSAAAKKADRVAAEGLIGVAAQGGAGALVEINAETDFVSRNDAFVDFVGKVAVIALAEKADEARIKAAQVDGVTVEARITQLIATIGENIRFRRAGLLEVAPGIVGSYVHNAVKPNLGRIGVLVALKSAADPDKLAELGRQLAMQVAATSPRALDIASLDPALVERERQVLADQAAQSGKPPAVVEKMLAGRVRKFYEEVVLLEQTFVVDGETKIADLLARTGKALGASVEITGFLRYALGEGIEKKESNFAEEVAAAGRG